MAPPSDPAEYDLYMQMIINSDPSIYGSWARNNQDCLAISHITLPGIKICQLCMVRGTSLHIVLAVPDASPCMPALLLAPLSSLL
jgi:hypothetical protein